MILVNSKLNKQAQYAIFIPDIFSRIEECVLKARTELAKRRLIQASIVLGGMKAVDEEMSVMAGWDQAQ